MLGSLTHTFLEERIVDTRKLSATDRTTTYRVDKDTTGAEPNRLKEVTTSRKPERGARKRADACIKDSLFLFMPEVFEIFWEANVFDETDT